MRLAEIAIDGPDNHAGHGLDSKTYLWSDDNLSNDYLWHYLKPPEVQRIVSYRNYGRVGCFKGFDPHSFSFNTRAEPSLFARQFQLMRRPVEAGFDAYGYATFTSDRENNLPQLMADFVDRLQSEIHAQFPLRLVPLRISPFTPTRSRMDDSSNRSLKIQETAVAAESPVLRTVSRRWPRRRLIDVWTCRSRRERDLLDLTSGREPSRLTSRTPRGAKEQPAHMF